MIGKALAIGIVIGLFVSVGTVFMSLILPSGNNQIKSFGWPLPWISTMLIPVHCTANEGFCPPSFSYQVVWQNLLIDWGIFSFIFFLLLIVLYKTNVLK